MELTAGTNGDQPPSADDQPFTSNLEAALAYGARGWPVFPLRARSKEPYEGFKWAEEATTDADTIREWFEGSDDNVGIACGLRSFWVIDCDDSDAVARVEALIKEHGGLAERPLIVRTRNGLHLIFAGAEDLRNTIKRLPGIDTRGAGGYVVAPPSIHPSGHRYKWLYYSDAPLEVPASWLADMFRSRAAPRKREHALPERLQTLTREILEAFAARARPELADAVTRILEGRSWAPPGKRDGIMHSLVGSLGVWVADKFDADIDPSDLEIFRASLEAATAEGVSRPTDLEWLAGKFLSSGAREFHADLKAEREEQAQEARREIDEMIAEATPAGSLDTLFARAPHGGLDRFKHTDSGNAERLAARHGHLFRFVASWGTWFVWDGRRWVRDEHEIRLNAAAKETVRNMYRSADEENDEDVAKALRSFAHASESRNARRNMSALLRSELPATLHTSLDVNPWLLNVQNGTIDLRTGQLRAHDPADLNTKITPVDFDPDAACPTWERFLLEVADGRIELVKYLQRAIGYSLTGDVSEHALFLCHGAGCNGKSVLVSTLITMLGEYAGKAPMDLLVRTGATKHETGMAKLCGLRLAAVTETEEGSSWAESVVKDLTGGDVITARRMREDFWDFRATHKFWVCANHAPNVRGSDEGIWRRLRKVPFDASFLGREDRGLPGKLETELPGILAWAVQGCLAWQRDGLQEPADVQAATTEYRHEHDLVGRFLAEECVRGEDKRVTRQDLYRAFEQWCCVQDDSSKPPKQRPFAARLRALGVTDASSVKTRDGRVREGWAGVALREHELGLAREAN